MNDDPPDESDDDEVVCVEGTAGDDCESERRYDDVAGEVGADPPRTTSSAGLAARLPPVPKLGSGGIESLRGGVA